MQDDLVGYLLGALETDEASRVSKALGSPSVGLALDLWQFNRVKARGRQTRPPLLEGACLPVAWRGGVWRSSLRCCVQGLPRWSLTEHPSLSRLASPAGR